MSCLVDILEIKSFMAPIRRQKMIIHWGVHDIYFTDGSLVAALFVVGDQKWPCSGIL